MQNKKIFYLILGLEILSVGLTAAGLIPKEANLVMTGIMAFYFLFGELGDSLILFIVSIPIFVAMPISESFDTMANWRILLVILFLRWFFVKKIRIDFKTKLAKFVILFLMIALLSLICAQNFSAGAKKVAFLINIFLLFPIVKNLAQEESFKSRINKAGISAMILSLVVGYGQLLITILKPLYVFWQWWAGHVSSVFYGSALAEVLKTSNTWFSYYSDSPPTLRMFSIFPDSHSFALFTIIGLISLVYPAIKKKSFWTGIVLSLLALVFSGSRAIWLSVFPVFLIFIACVIFKNKIKISQYIQPYAKTFLIMLMIFVLAFPVSSFVLSKSFSGSDGTLAFKRAKTIIDTDELSVKSRIGIWKTSFNSILQHPLLGVGIGNYPLVLGEEISSAKKGASAHNLYLDVASEMGLFGLIALILIFLEILTYSFKQMKYRNFQIVFLFFFAWILIYNFFDVVLLNDKVLLLFMVILGLVYKDEQISVNQHSDL